MIIQKPFLLEYELNDMLEYRSILASALHTSVVNNEIIYPDDIANGSSKFFRINEYISFQIARYTAKEQMIFKRIPSKRNHVVISFQSYSFTKCTVHNFQCNEIVLTNNKIGSIQCKDTRLPETVLVEAGLEERSIQILLDELWLEKVIGNDVYKDRFYRYVHNKQANLRKEYLSGSQLELFYEIVDKCRVSPLENLYYESRVLNLLESFLRDVMLKEEILCNEIHCSDESMKLLQLAEKNISDNVMYPFASVDKLSKLSCMSRTKFINLFQKIYGLSPFEYYQKKRLQIAYDMLKSGKYSVKDTANRLGYIGISNFTNAFKKFFGFLPSNLKEEAKD